MTRIRYPFGELETHEMTASGDQDFNIDSNYILIDGETVPATGNRTLNLTIDEVVLPGAILIVKSNTSGVETLTYGVGLEGTTETGTAGKTQLIQFVYDGINFKKLSAANLTS